MDSLIIPVSTTNSQGRLSHEDDSEELRTLWVGSIKEKVDEEILFELFMNSGPVAKVTIPLNKETRKPKTFAFVLFEHKESIQYAIQQMSGITLFGQKLILKPCFNRRQALSDTSNQAYEVNQNVLRKPLGLEENNLIKIPLELSDNQNCVKTELDTSRCSAIKVTLLDPYTKTLSLRDSRQIFSANSEIKVFKGDQEGVLKDQDFGVTHGRWILSADERNLLLKDKDQRERSREREKRRERNGQRQLEGNSRREISGENDSRNRVSKRKIYNRSYKCSREKSQSISRYRESDDREHDTYLRDRSRSRRKPMGKRERYDRSNDRYLRGKSRSRSRGTRERDSRNGSKHFRDRSHSQSRHGGIREEKHKDYKVVENVYKKTQKECTKSRSGTETKYEFNGPVPVKKTVSRCGNGNQNSRKNDGTKSTGRKYSQQATHTSKDLEEGEIHE